ncbi:HEPN-associated N-terminal domain-containing protein, partial [Acinetobacter baumannii]|nr:HEPN-associated N-terminal domain-containing protein [Acinetobacter baumannii]
NKIYQTIFNYYGNAGDLNIPFDEGEWVVGSTSIEDVLFEINPGWDDNFSIDLANSAAPWLYLVKHSNGDWLEVPESETLLYSWDSFKNQILYKTRYLFLNEPNDDFADNQIIPVSSMLNALEKLCIELNLIKKVKKNSFFYRVRSHSKEESFSEFDHMGVAPLRIATAGRMNPA